MTGWNQALPWEYDDGGRVSAGFKGEAGDCVTRAISIATGVPYQQVYDELFDLMRDKPKLRGTNSPRAGVPKKIIRKYMETLGWRWTPTMSIGSGTTVHLADGELPSGRLVVQVTKHVCAVIDGVVRDTHDPTREGTRCVYGYWQKPGDTAEVPTMRSTRRPEGKRR